MCKRNKNLVCNRISTKLFLLFVCVMSPWHVYEDGADVSMGLWDSCESQNSAENEFWWKNLAAYKKQFTRIKWDRNGLRYGIKALQRVGVLFSIP